MAACVFLVSIFRIPSLELKAANFSGAGGLWNEREHFGKGLTGEKQGQGVGIETRASGGGETVGTGWG
jgi:hypothetical protein